MIEHPVAGHAAVGVTVRPRESRAGGGERLDAEALKIAGAAHVPRIGDDETTRFMQPVKCAALVGNAGTYVVHALLLGDAVRGYCARDGALAHAAPSMYIWRMNKNNVRWLACLLAVPALVSAQDVSSLVETYKDIHAHP